MTGAASEHEFRELCDRAAEGILIVMPGPSVDLHVVYANPAARRLLAFTDEEPKAGLASLSPAINESTIGDYCRKAFATRESHRIAVSFRGERHPRSHLLAEITPFGEGRASVHLSAQDLSSIEGFAVEDVWRSMAETPVDWLCVLDQRGRYLYVNRTAPGLTYEELIGKATIYDFTPEAHHPIVRTAIERAFQQGALSAWDWFIDYTGSWYHNVMTPVTRDGKVYAVAVASKDITQQEQTKLALQESEAQFRSLADHAPTHILLLDRV
jgi:PAS domain S-box-containing protein